MRFAIVSCHLPEPEGNSPGRALLALGDGLVEGGHEVDVWSWRPEPPRDVLPSWCRWEPLPPEPAWRTRARALVRPRGDVVRAGWTPPDGAVALADELTSVDAVLASDSSVACFHYRTALDLAALHQRATPWHVQQLRLERRAARLPALVLGYSERVRSSARTERSRYVPMGYPIPPVAVPPVDEPVVALLAGWYWPPNRWALERLLEAWPEVRASVPAARLVLAGRGLPGGVGDGLPSGLPSGVEWVGEVEAAAEVLHQTAVFAFPCPPTSGPKGKVIEALAYGLPVLTTPAGVEGLAVVPGRDVVVAPVAQFAAALAALLQDPERRAALGAAGRAAMEAGHSPLAVARARVAACGDAFPTLAR